MSGDETTPLVQGQKPAQKAPQTPLPKKQVSIILLILLAQPISAQHIFPFINQWIRELGVTGGDDRKLGYYAGLIESLYYVAQAATVLHWSRLSDYIGRKPVVLFGLTGLMVSNLCFGLSQSFWALVVSRSIAGLLNGNVGVTKSVMGEITDRTNMAQGFALVPPMFSIGAFIAPLYGGMLAKPHDRWPKVFSGEFWQRHPYFLSCVVAASFTAIAAITAALFLEEVRMRPTTNTIDDADDGPPVSIGVMMRTRSVMIPIANYGLLAIMEIAILAMLPLFYATPIEIGGLGLSPSSIGVGMASFGLGNGIFQVLIPPRLARRCGVKKVLRWAVFAYFPVVVMFPILSAAVEPTGEVTQGVWMLMIVQLVFMTVAEAAFAVLLVFITRAAPNRHSLGTMNGLSQTTTSISRAVGPALVTSLFAISKERNLLGGNLVYLVMWGLAGCLLFMSSHLPDLGEEE